MEWAVGLDVVCDRRGFVVTAVEEEDNDVPVRERERAHYRNHIT